MSQFLSCTSRLAALGLALATAVSTAACAQEGNATCGDAPATEITAFVVTTTTGDDCTNADIHFCYARKSTGAEECKLLDELMADDFESGEVNTFEVPLGKPIVPGDFDYFTIKNSGHGFLDNSWQMTGLRVVAIDRDGAPHLLYEEQLDEQMDEGDSYGSWQCEY